MNLPPLPFSPSGNIALFRDVRNGLSKEQMEIFPICFVGAISSFVPEDVWQMAIEIAAQAVDSLKPEPQKGAHGYRG